MPWRDPPRWGACRARRFEAGVAKQLRRDDEIGLAAHERGRERVPEHVRGHVLVEPGSCRDAGDQVVGAFGAQAPAALVEEQRRALIGSGPVLAFVLPVLEPREVWWIGTPRTRSPLPRIRSTPLRADRRTSSRSSATVSEIRAGAGVEWDQRQCPVPRRRSVPARRAGSGSAPSPRAPGARPRGSARAWRWPGRGPSGARRRE